MVIEIMHFLQPLYLAYLIALAISVYRCVFYNEEKAGKVGVSFTFARDDVNREVLHLDTQLMKATYLVITFALFYLVPTWMSCFIYFIAYPLFLIGGMSAMKMSPVAAKPKVE